MSSLTSRVSLYKPAGGENINVTTDLNNNLDSIDTNLNFRVVASATARNAISPFWAGLNVRETDTGKLYVSNGTPPISASWDQIHTSNTYNTALNLSAAATGTIVFNLRLGSDANNKIQIRGDGAVFWGAGGGTAVDTNLYRSAANTLKTDDALVVAGAHTVEGATSLNSTLAVTGNTTLAGDLTVGGIGQKQFVSNTANQTVTNSTTMVNATNLVVPVVANGTYVFRCFLLTSGGNAAGDIKFGFTMPTGALVDYAGQGQDIALASGSLGSIITQAQEAQSSPTTALQFGVSTNINVVEIMGQLRMSSTAGNFQLQFAQQSANATGSVLRARSFMTVTRVA